MPFPSFGGNLQNLDETIQAFFLSLVYSVCADALSRSRTMSDDMRLGTTVFKWILSFGVNPLVDIAMEASA